MNVHNEINLKFMQDAIAEEEELANEINKKKRNNTNVDNGINSEFSQDENIDETEEPEREINVNKGSDDIKKLGYRIEHIEEETMKLRSEIVEKDNIIKKQKERIMKE
ncbi:uncharacterized protein LOC117173177 [Belonocnema kinseyi]|uniref:uncharacterized protein LOC117173177 n=1 Tax=Belonocnema kinseyi TaxID=2817044 RepID=UPI00143DD23A|nr:uncharacterized protein LOC117173177 [Belonocnema kinseyi]XP_033217486.1 uncharacterized protein LOC117173177 [Belonocnema kinseyi]